MRDQPGEVHIEVTGTDLSQLSNEAGCHKLQRVPPTERNGRVHTSAITVAVIDPTQFTTEDYSSIASSDLKVEWYSGTGCGGQNRNKVQTSCRLTHLPTGMVRTAQTRSRTNSYNEAYRSLIEALQQEGKLYQRKVLSDHKTTQMGNGSNSNVVRSYCFQHNFVKSLSGRKISIDQFEKGCIDLLWE